MTVTLRIKFADEDDLRGWVETAQLEDTTDPRLGCRAADALDDGSRVHPGEFILSTDPGPGGWLVEPLVTNDGR